MTGNATKRPVKCGSWPSPLDAALVAGRTVALSTLRADHAALYWLENRPSEAGRGVLCRQDPAGVCRDVTAAPFDVGSRVHEYGGGAYAVRDGRIGFSHRPDGSVWLIEPDAPPRPVCTVPGVRFADFCFTPDGRHLLAVREDHRDHAATQPSAAIVAFSLDPSLDAASQAGEILVDGADFLAAPRLCADGTRLAWIAWDHPDMPWDATRLQLGTIEAAPDGGLRLSGARCLAGGARDEALMQPLFDAGGTLHVCSDRSGWWNLYRATEGGLQPICPMAREIGQPPWVFGQRSYDFLPDGRIVVAAIEAGRTAAMLLSDGRAAPLAIGPVVECPVVLARPGGTASLGWLSAAPDRATSVLTAPLDQPEAVRVAAVAHALPLDDGDIAVAETIRFPVPDGRGGTTLAHAFYYPPTSRGCTVPEGERPPLLVMAHGGPTAMTSAACSLRVQWWTSRGIGVVDVNYGGSTGFGRDYRRRLDGAWGIVDVDDCIAACTSLIEAGRVDPARIAIRGSSAGGFTVLAALARSDLFSAACCLYGIGDLRLLAQETHKFEARYLDRLIGRLPQDLAVYEARSPIRQLDAVRCPVVFFHGLEDKVVPVAQTRAMAEALRARGLAVAVHEFADEAHGFRQEATIRQVLERELAFYGSRFGFTPSAASTAPPG